LSADDNQDGADRFQRSPTGPAVAPPPLPNAAPSAAAVKPPLFRPSFWSIAVFVLVVSGIGIRAYRDLSRPDAWDYWKDQYISPSLTVSVIDKTYLDGRDQGRRTLAVSGTIGPAAAKLLRDRIGEAKLAAGDLILLSSPGGELNQGAIMGEIIRSHGLATAVGTSDGSGRIKPAYCASACVLVYAGGKPRYGVLGSALGVHRFVSEKPMKDPIADAQRITGAVLGYMTKMGVASSVVEAMSETREIRWLAPKDALAMNLITDPVSRP
jgi:hypothetical protein